MPLPIIYPSIGLLLQVLYMMMSKLFFSQHCNCVHFVEPLVLCSKGLISKEANRKIEFKPFKCRTCYPLLLTSDAKRKL